MRHFRALLGISNLLIYLASISKTPIQNPSIQKGAIFKNPIFRDPLFSKMYEQENGLRPRGRVKNCLRRRCAPPQTFWRMGDVMGMGDAMRMSDAMGMGDAMGAGDAMENG